ncbi:MAG: hypothetical protein M0Z71_04770 [Nitrospiraceae bacterium]|nr:hypothetical protein [Nitrospiraceae bacterium]
MAKVINQDIKDLGFTKELFNKADDNSFSTFIDNIIAEQSLILSGRVGSSKYNSTDSPTKDYVKMAEKCLVAAEMVSRRINIILQNIQGSGQEIGTSVEKAQKKDYVDQAESWIAKIAASVTADSSSFASGVLTTSHFEVPSA